MILTLALLINNLGLFIFEVIGYHLCHSVVMLLDGYFHLCQTILCTVRIVSRRIQFTYTPRHTYGLARVGVVGELVAFVSFLSLSISVFLETVKHLIDVIFVIPKRESDTSTTFTAHGTEHIHSLIDHPKFILCVGIYATISNCLLGTAIVYTMVKRARKIKQQFNQRQLNFKQPLPKNLTKSLLITDTLPIRHSFHQVINMFLGPIAILTCGILLLLSEKHHVRVIYSRLVDPIIGCVLFLSYVFMIRIPARDVIHLVLQAKPYGLKSDEIETTVLETVPGVVAIHELHIWRLTPQKTLATAHVTFNTTENILIKYQDINLVFQTYDIDHVTIQPEFLLTSDEINRLGRQCQCSVENAQCTPLRCCENQTTENVNRTSSSSSRKIYFHRRSSVGLASIESDSNIEHESETQQEKDSIKNFSTLGLK